MHDKLSTLTNASFLIVAFLIPDLYTSVTLIALGITSGLYHALKTRFWRHADVISIYYVLLAVIAFLSGISWLYGFILATILAFAHTKIRSHAVIGALAVVALLIHGSLIPLLFFSLWGLSNIPWIYIEKGFFRDFTHSLSHIFASLAIYFVF